MTQAPPTIPGERFALCRWRAHDLDELHATLLRCERHLCPWIPFVQRWSGTRQDTQSVLTDAIASFDQGRHWRYAIRALATRALLGEAMLIGRGGPGTLELGYWLDPDACGRGIATDAARALLPVAFEALHAERVQLCCDVRNTSSLRVAERLGAQVVGEEHRHEHGSAVTLRVFELSRMG